MCWGIEMGAGAVKAIKLERSGDEVNVVEFAVIPHKKVLTTPDLDQADATRVALGELVTRFDLTDAPVAISVPGHSAFARFAKLPPVEPKKIPDIVKFEAVQQIPFPIDDVEWDYQTFQSPDNPDVEVGIFAITRDRVMERLALWADVGISPDFITLGPLAAYNAISWDMQFGPQTPGTVILDVGTTSTDLIICEPGRVWIRTFPIGGHNFTEALVSAFKLSYAKAEALKAQAEQSKHARHILQAMRPVFSDLAQDVQRSIGYYQSSHRDANLTRLIGLGSTFNLPGLRKYLSQQLQMEVVRLEQFNRISVDGPAQSEFQAGTMNLATAYGLSLQGLGFEHGIMANLVPVAVVREAMWKKKVKWFGIAAGIALAAGAVSFIRPFLDDAAVASSPRLPVIDETIRSARTLKAEWKTVSDTFAPDYRAANVAGLLASREIYPHIADDLGQMLKSAIERAAEQRKDADFPNVRFGEYQTAYIPPAGAQADPYGAEPDPSMATPASGEQRVSGELELSTTHKDDVAAVEFATETIKKWLYDNADRAGVPYTIDVGKVSVTLVESRRLAPSATDLSAPPSGRDSLATRPTVPGRTPVSPLDSRAPVNEFDGLANTRLSSAPDEGPSSPTGPSTQGREDVDRLAPLTDAEPLAKPGQTLNRLRVRWEVILRRDTPAEENPS
jgi:type IV pilus assembly protein PilM